MQQFQVPQFIDIEDKLIGPLTLKQFFYLLGAAGVGLIGWFYLHIILFVIIALPVALLFVAMAFGKINGRPFPTVFTGAINYYLKPRLYLWRQDMKKPSTQSGTKATADAKQPLKQGAESPLPLPKLSESKLSDLAWSLDIKERIEER